MDGYLHHQSTSSTGSVGSDSFGSQRRRALEKNEGNYDEEVEQLFDQHNNQQIIYDNRHHDLNFDDDYSNSAISSIGDHASLGEGTTGSKGSVRTRDELRMSLIARRRRLAEMNLLGSKNQHHEGECDGSLVSSLRDSLTTQGSLQSLLNKSKKKTGGDKGKDKKKKKERKRQSKKQKHRETEGSLKKSAREKGKDNKRRSSKGELPFVHPISKEYLIVFSKCFVCT